MSADPADPKAVDRILLIGMMGAGKTTVGHALSKRLGWPYLDNDELLARAVGKDTRRVQQEDGVAALRHDESLALAAALAEPPPVIAGVAAGVVTDPADRERLRTGGYVVWLRADLHTLARRVRGTDRPWLGDEPEQALRELYAGRAELYAEVASLVVDVDDTTPLATADRIVAAIPSRSPGAASPTSHPSG